MSRPILISAVVLGLSLGLAGGIGAYTFIYAKGASYLTSDPRACANCHVMNDQYDAWRKSSHHAVATCSDCHMPHALVPKYMTKAENGFRHSLAFTTGRFHEPIMITPRDKAITEAACRRCHPEIVAMIDHPTPGSEPLDCLRCHDSVGHMHLDIY